MSALLQDDVSSIKASRLPSVVSGPHRASSHAASVRRFMKCQDNQQESDGISYHADGHANVSIRPPCRDRRDMTPSKRYSVVLDSPTVANSGNLAAPGGWSRSLR